MSLPKAFVIGAPKAGTTTLCAALMRHPSIYMYPKKETHFFNQFYDERGMDWYRNLFSAAPAGALIMEGTPDYAMSHCAEKTAERISTHIPDAKLIYMVREPIERIESHYVQEVSNTRQMITIEQALRVWPEIVNTSDYGAILEVFERRFSKENIKVVFLEDYKKNKRRIHMDILEFLGLQHGDDAVLALMNEQEVLHKRENQGVDGTVLSHLRRWRHYDRLNMLLPRRAIDVGKRFLRKPLKVDSSLPEPIREKLEQELVPKWEVFQKEHRLF